MKEKSPAPPKPTPAPDDRRTSSRLAGLILAGAGILLMLLSGWAPPVGATPWEGASERSSIVSGGLGDDDLFGNPGGGDVIVAGEGDDFIEAKDGARDHISCGPGEDVASVDGGPGDVVASDCETVYGS